MCFQNGTELKAAQWRSAPLVGTALRCVVELGGTQMQHLEEIDGLVIREVDGVEYYDVADETTEEREIMK